MGKHFVFDSLATIPNLKKLNLSRNRLEGWSGTTPMMNLEDLFFAHNTVQHESALSTAISLNPKLKFLLITGNPFAFKDDYQMLE